MHYLIIFLHNSNMRDRMEGFIIKILRNRKTIVHILREYDRINYICTEEY